MHTALLNLNGTAFGQHLIYVIAADYNSGESEARTPPISLS